MLIAIAYDIPDDRRRSQLAKLLSRFGDRVQYSLFEAELSDAQFNALRSAVKRVISSEADSVRYYLLGNKASARVKIEGRGAYVQRPTFILA